MNATAMLGRLEETSPRLKARIAGVLCLLTVLTGLTWLSMTGHFRERETSRLSPSAPPKQSLTEHPAVRTWPPPPLLARAQSVLHRR